MGGDLLREKLQRATHGQYLIEGELGRGGMASVYLAHEIALDRRVAIKVMSPQLLSGEGMVERFRQEAMTVARLSHPHIVTIHAVREADDLHYFVMKYVEGASLDRVVRAVGALSVPAVQVIIRQVAGALHYAHRRGVIHRDTKPGNIMLDEDGNAVVTDFGIARVAAGPRLTIAGGAIGTPEYMSPEQCDGRELTGASDQYSLGIVAYELLTGAPPFAGSALTVMFAHAREVAAPVARLRPDCPAAAAAVVARMLEKDPARRWPDMGAVADAIGGPLPHQDHAVRSELGALATRRDTDRRSPEPSSPPPSSPLSPTPVASVSVEPAQISLRIGEPIQLRLVAHDARGAEVPSGEVAWASSIPNMVTVSPEGVVVGLALGTAEITAWSGGLSGSAHVGILPGTILSPAFGMHAPTTEPVPAATPGWPTITPGAATPPAPPHPNALGVGGRTGDESWPPAYGSRVRQPRRALWVFGALTGLVAAAGLVAWLIIPESPVNGETIDERVPRPTAVAVDPRPELQGAPPASSGSDDSQGEQAPPPATGSETPPARGGGVPDEISRPEPVTTPAIRDADSAAITVADSARIAAESNRVAGLRIVPATVSMTLGERVDIRVEALDVMQRPITNAAITWESSNPEVASLDPATRVLVGTSVGTTTLSARADDVQADVRVTVEAPRAIVRPEPAPTVSDSAEVTASRVRSITAGGAITCVVWQSGATSCRGPGRATPAIAALSRDGAQLAIGASHACALTGGAATCWGENGSGQLGDGGTRTRSEPAPVAGDLRFVTISVGGTHTCGIAQGGRAYCWGANNSGQLGDGSQRQRAAPAAVSGDLTFTAVTAGREHTCAIATNGSAWCWGYGFAGALGHGFKQNEDQPREVATRARFTRIGAGANHTCALASDGRVHCWGDNAAGQLGDGTTRERIQPVPLAGSRTFTQLAVGVAHACGLAGDGVVGCWGQNAHGQLGTGTRTRQSAPATLSGTHRFATLVAGARHTCGLTSEGQAFCWGDNAGGQLGIGNQTAVQTTPAPVVQPE